MQAHQGVAALPALHLHEVFELRAREAPDRIAVCSDGDQITYGELNARADRLAARLREFGVGPDVRVALCVDRSIDLVVAVVGTAKSGGAYVPVDPDYPEKRLRFLLEDSSAAAVVAVSRVAERLRQLPTPPVLWLDGEEDPPVERPAPSSGGSASRAEGGEPLAYVIYTSGSTGAPKGVMVEHRSVVRLFDQTRSRFGFDHLDVWTLFHSIGFDFSVWELWGAVLHGARLVIVPETVKRSPKATLALLKRERVTILNQTPSAFRLLLATEGAAGDRSGLALRLVIFGGERLDVSLLERWFERHGDQDPVVVNMYGITETTVHVTHKRIRRRDLDRPEVSPIGVPIRDLRVHLLDAAGEPVPDGVPGEIHVSGPGLARGYLGRPELTESRFPTLPSPEGEREVRMYRSGDRAVREPNGELFYLGRVDDQVKVRGFRIEPREVEQCLSRHTEVEAVVVAARRTDDGDRHLVAYLLPRSRGVMSAQRATELTVELDELAGDELPSHMRPASYRLVMEIPMTPHGKVDREALEQLDGGPVRGEDGAEAPLTPTERAIVRIGQEVLERRTIGLHDDLFDLGVSSLAFMRIVAEVNARFDITLTGAELGEEATVEALAACADAAVSRNRNKELA